MGKVRRVRIAWLIESLSFIPLQVPSTGLSLWQGHCGQSRKSAWQRTNRIIPQLAEVLHHKALWLCYIIHHLSSYGWKSVWWKRSRCCTTVSVSIRWISWRCPYLAPGRDFLTSEGVLLRPDVQQLKYHVASLLIDGLIRTRVIPSLFRNAPAVPIPDIRTNVPDILFILTESLKCFDKDLIQSAYFHSYKYSMVPVNGHRKTAVPRESVYDTELMRILTNWLRISGWSVTDQQHTIIDNGRHKYSDIVLQKHDDEPIVLELLATEEGSLIKDHIDKTPTYMNVGYSFHLRRQLYTSLANFCSTEARCQCGSCHTWDGFQKRNVSDVHKLYSSAYNEPVMYLVFFLKSRIVPMYFHSKNAQNDKCIPYILSLSQTSDSTHRRQLGQCWVRRTMGATIWLGIEYQRAAVFGKRREHEAAACFQNSLLFSSFWVIGKNIAYSEHEGKSTSSYFWLTWLAVVLPATSLSPHLLSSRDNISPCLVRCSILQVCLK